MKNLIIGTPYFPSQAAAVRYFSDYEEHSISAVELKLKEGSIHIGKPFIKKGEKVLLHRIEERYFILEG